MPSPAPQSWLTKLVSHNFVRGTIGFKSVDDPIGDATAVCILPGTELAFDKPIKLRWSYYEGKGIERQFTTAIFRQRDKDKPNAHHDVLEMPDGQQILLTHLEEGQNATVLQQTLVHSRRGNNRLVRSSSPPSQRFPELTAGVFENINGRQSDVCNRPKADISNSSTILIGTIVQAAELTVRLKCG
jgi:hypothetical protein